MGKPNLPDINTLISMGINPKTGLPYKWTANDDGLIDDILKVLRVVDEQDAIGRYKWYNLPDGLDGDLIERILYYRYHGIFFYHKVLDKFYFLPYALDGTIDVYGRYTGCRPLPFNGTTDDGKDKNNHPISLNSYTPKYGIMQLEDLTIEDFENSCVILEDYCKQISQNAIPRQALNDPVLKLESQCLPLMRTSLIANSGVKGIRVGTSDDADNVEYASRALKDAALKGQPYMPIVGTMEFQDLTGTNGNSKAEEYLMAMQSIENFRLGLYGIDSGGVFEKKAHVLEAEQAMNKAPVSIAFQDGLSKRQNFCNIVNSIWGLSIWCEPSEAVLGIDTNSDGVLYDVEDTGTQEQGGNDNANNSKM